MNITTIIALISSLVLNSFLLIYLFGLIPFTLFLSGITNVLFVSYIGYLLRERNEVQNDFFDLLSNLESYSNKLLQTYELEMFYGDDTLEDLLNSSKTLVNKFYSYEDKYYNTQDSKLDQDQGSDLDDRNSEED